MKPREIKNRMRGLEQTVAITAAMQTISAAKISPLQSRLQRSVACCAALERMLSISDVNNAFTALSRDAAPILVVISAERGLCGKYNVMMNSATRETSLDKIVAYYPIGRDVTLPHEAVRDDAMMFLLRSPISVAANTAAEILSSDFESGRCDAIYVLYTDPDALNSPRLERILPLRDAPMSESVTTEVADEGTAFVRRVLRAKLDRIFNSALLSENITRMAAMKFATTNGRDMLADLETVYHQTRQNDITSELNDAVNAQRSKEI